MATSRRGSASQLSATTGLDLNKVMNVLSKARATGFGSDATVSTDTVSSPTTLSGSSGMLSSSSGAAKTSDLLSTIASINAAKRGAVSPDTWNAAKTVSAGLNAAKGLYSQGAMMGIPIVGYVTAGANLGKLAKSRISNSDIRDTSGASLGEMIEREASAPGVGGVLDPGISALIGKIAGKNPFTTLMGELRNAENQMIVTPVANVSSGIMGDGEKAVRNIGYIAIPGSQYLSETAQNIVNPANLLHNVIANVGDKIAPNAPAGVQTALGGIATVLNPAAALAIELNLPAPPGPTDNDAINTGLAFATGGLSVFCFAKGTHVILASGLELPIEMLDLNDELLLGGRIVAVGKAIGEEMYEYKDVIVEGSHAVFENGKWLRVKDSAFATRIPESDGCVVYPLVCVNHLIVAERNIYSDMVETPLGWGVSDDDRIGWLNGQHERNSKLSEIGVQLQAIQSGERLRNADFDLESIWVEAHPC